MRKVNNREEKTNTEKNFFIGTSFIQINNEHLK